ncbi:putative serine dehydratase domain-containing protein [Lasiosphaeria miniovina]|uniref:D-serine dehydratase n=1 Tax=Lasiosphaeria miniovina TaxID=1954250 RepID=A0AA40EE42_9PEZI|nr:putative serine dehydratase domain-containing protein [Lasiosphaeria miniovina]KAK0735037.1 putative serine dehydratase domain-containing protein [Lasiosphaeria miniovina]
MAVLSAPGAGLKEKLRAEFVGMTLQDVIPVPSAVLDLAKLEVNCQRMLDATDRLGILWRAHIKSHKTTELTRLQVGDTRMTHVSIIASTVVEAENILPLLREYQVNGRTVNLLLAFPLFPSAVSRLARFSAELGPASLSILVDHPDQLASAAAITRASGGHAPLVFIKIDAEYGRAGVVPSSPACAELVDAALAAEKAGACVLHGLYAHAGHSYGSRGNWAAMDYLVKEFEMLSSVAAVVRDKSPDHPLVLSAGATPTATTIQHPRVLAGLDGDNESTATSTHKVKSIFNTSKLAGLTLEVHAGVYPTLDIQQLATHARDSSLMTCKDIAISIVAEVASVYPGRGADGTTEALVHAGTLALGREPVAGKGGDYSGWGVVMSWGAAAEAPGPGPDFPLVHGGWQVGRISQEHGILAWKGRKEDEVPLRVGDRVRIWPNHSCIAGAGFDWYLIVDGRNKGREDEVVDVWPRWRGW